MAKNRKSIQFLRGSNASISYIEDALLPGQPLYNKDDNTLTIGGDISNSNEDNGNSLTKKSINASGLKKGTAYSLLFNPTSGKFTYLESYNKAFDNSISLREFTQSNIADGEGIGSIKSGNLDDDDGAYSSLSSATGHESIAWGKKAIAAGKRSVSIGNGNKSFGNCSFVIGQINSAMGEYKLDGNSNYILDESGNKEVNSNANVTFVGGRNNIATGDATLMFGVNNRELRPGNTTPIIGLNNWVDAQAQGLVMGHMHKIASTQYASIIGYSNQLGYFKEVNIVEGTPTTNIYGVVTNIDEVTITLDGNYIETQSYLKNYSKGDIVKSGPGYHYYYLSLWDNNPADALTSNTYVDWQGGVWLPLNLIKIDSKYYLVSDTTSKTAPYKAKYQLSSLIGHDLLNKTTSKMVLGAFNEDKEDNIFEIGDGYATLVVGGGNVAKTYRRNAIEIHRDIIWSSSNGEDETTAIDHLRINLPSLFNDKMKCVASPTETDDVARWQDLYNITYDNGILNITKNK